MNVIAHERPKVIIKMEFLPKKKIYVTYSADYLSQISPSYRKMHVFMNLYKIKQIILEHHFSQLTKFNSFTSLMVEKNVLTWKS